MPVEKKQGDRVIGATVNSTGTFIMKAKRWAPKQCWPGSSRWLPTRSAAGRRSRNLPTRSPATSCRSWLRSRSSRSSSGPGSDRNRGSHTLWSMRLPCLSSPAPARWDWLLRCPSWSPWAKERQAACLFKNAEAIEMMKKVDTLVVDKTGTLTLGKPKLVDGPVSTDSMSDPLLYFAASLERGSEHPLAAAIVTGARERGVDRPDATHFRVQDRQRGRRARSRAMRRARQPPAPR